MPLVWHITQRCNLGRCFFCRADASTRACAGEVEQSLIVDVCRQYAKMSDVDVDTKKVYFTGGEPFVRPDCTSTICEVSHNVGLPVAVVTNGTLLTKDRVRALKDCGAEVSVSLDGPAVAHDRMRGMKCYDTVVRSIDSLLSAGITVDIHPTVAHVNYDALKSRAFLDLLATRFRVARFIALSGIDPVGRGGTCTHEVVPEEDLLRLEDLYASTFGAKRVIRRKPRLTAIRIDHLGHVHALAAMGAGAEYSDGNVKSQSLTEILSAPSLWAYFARPDLSTRHLLWVLTRQIAACEGNCDGKTLAAKLDEALSPRVYLG